MNWQHQLLNILRHHCFWTCAKQQLGVVISTSKSSIRRFVITEKAAVLWLEDSSSSCISVAWNLLWLVKKHIWFGRRGHWISPFIGFLTYIDFSSWAKFFPPKKHWARVIIILLMMFIQNSDQNIIHKTIMVLACCCVWSFITAAAVLRQLGSKPVFSLEDYPK